MSAQTTTATDVEIPVVVANAIEEFRSIQQSAYDRLLGTARAVEAGRQDEVDEALLDLNCLTGVAQDIDQNEGDSAATWLAVDDLTTALSAAESAHAAALSALEGVFSLRPF